MVVIMVIVGAVVIGGLIVAFMRYKKIGIFSRGILLNYKLLNTCTKYLVCYFLLKSCRIEKNAIKVFKTPIF